MTIAAHFPSPFSQLVWVHVLAGAAALLTFWIPIVTKKGGKLHSRSGWVFLGGLSLVITAAVIITPWRFFFDPNRTPEGKEFSVFLFYISIFSGVAMQQGLVVFRDSDKTTLSRSKTLLPPALLAFVAVPYAIQSALHGHWLYLIFGALGFHLARNQFAFWKQAKRSVKDRWFFHLENMFICCIATVTAFGVTAIPRLVPGAQFNSVWVWLAPSLVMVPLKFYLKAKYARSFQRRGHPAEHTAPFTEETQPG